MNRRNQRQRNRIQLPLTVRQAQKVVAKAIASQERIRGLDTLSSAIRLEWGSSLQEIKPILDRLAVSKGAGFLIEEVCYDYDEYEDDLDFEEDEEESGADSPGADDTQSTAENCESSGSDDSDSQDGDSDSGEYSAQANSQSEEGQPQTGGQQQPGNVQGTGASQAEEHRDGSQRSRGASQPACPETGEVKSEVGNDDEPSSESTSGKQGQDGNDPNPDRSVEDSSSAALEEGNHKSDKNQESGEDQRRNTDSQESGDSHLSDTSSFGEQSTRSGLVGNDADEPGECVSDSAEEIGDGNENQPGDDDPTHQKKWGKKFNKAEKSKLSANANTNHGGLTASLQGIGVDAKLLKLCRQRLAALVGDSSQEYSPRRDYQEFCIRLKTFRNPQPARKEEQGRPVILIMADVSGSCASFSGESVAVAKAASKLGVPGADVLVLSHSNGQPEELEHNGKMIPVEEIAPSNWRWSSGDAAWYEALTQRFQVQAVIALGDWDAANDYARLMLNPGVERFIWLDNAYCSSRGTVQDRTKLALSRIKEQGLAKLALIRHKLVYRDGCKDAIAFISNIV